MKGISVLAIASSALAAAIKDSSSGSIAKSLDGAQGANLAMRDDDIKVLCGAPPDYPDSDFPAQDYSYPIGLLLGGGDHKLHVDAGPAKCIQAACNSGGGAGVFVCNDQHNGVDLLYTDIGWFAQRVYEKCKHRLDDGTDHVQKGQAFCPDNWNVILTTVGSDCTASTPPSSNQTESTH
ncbi:hypothetical protein F5Y13DRAFT_187443 [Hypoxylon sp. FL1857]|nr:hypothetical protein F5Y13DRAFT_187443 [Hypoxylon sp. FL1857]